MPVNTYPSGVKIVDGELGAVYQIDYGTVRPIVRLIQRKN